jgi:methyl-accepting chemotaxis protein
MRFTISRAINLFGLVTAFGFGAVIFTSVFALNELKVGGPLYTRSRPAMIWSPTSFPRLST